MTMLEEAAREYVAATDAWNDSGCFATNWVELRTRRDEAQRVLWAACGRVEFWPESEPENA